MTLILSAFISTLLTLTLFVTALSFLPSSLLIFFIIVSSLSLLSIFSSLAITFPLLGAFIDNFVFFGLPIQLGTVILGGLFISNITLYALEKIKLIKENNTNTVEKYIPQIITFILGMTIAACLIFTTPMAISNIAMISLFIPGLITCIHLVANKIQEAKTSHIDKENNKKSTEPVQETEQTQEQSNNQTLNQPNENSENFPTETRKDDQSNNTETTMQNQNAENTQPVKPTQPLPDTNIDETLRADRQYDIKDIQQNVV